MRKFNLNWNFPIKLLITLKFEILARKQIIEGIFYKLMIYAFIISIVWKHPILKIKFGFWEMCWQEILQWVDSHVSSRGCTTKYFLPEGFLKTFINLEWTYNVLTANRSIVKLRPPTRIIGRFNECRKKSVQPSVFTISPKIF